MASHVGGSSHKKKRKNWKKPIPEHTPQSKKKQTELTSATSCAPRGINVAEFAESRALEIHNMVEAIANADRSSRKRLFQQLPRHMRRRAMSHNIKRLPVRLREDAQAEMDKFPKQNEGKKKSRRYRRKPKNLLAEYTRRQRQHVWLETHIWHAKRMKMIDIWGFRLAEHPCDKGFRAAHRAVTSSCTIQDISYYGCIEVSGKQTQIIAAIARITNQDAGPTIKSPQYLNGCKEGHLVLYHIDTYPYGAVGQVSFVWRQSKFTDSHADTNEISPPSAKKPKLECVEFYQPDSESDISQLWIWSHPSCFNEVFDVIIEACQMVAQTVVKKDSPPEPDKKMEKQINKDKYPDKSVTHAGNEHKTHSSSRTTACGTIDFACSNGENTEEVITVISLRQDFVRFRLTGPQSHTLLQSALILHNPDEQIGTATTNGMDVTEKSFSHDVSISTKQGKNKKWWKECSSDITKKQNELWISLKQVSTPGLLPSGSIVSLIVMDPRLNMPHKKTSVDSTAEEGSKSDEVASCNLPCPTKFLVQWPKGLAVSPIWVHDTRTVVKETKMSEHELNRRRSEQLVPGTEPRLADDASRIPILLLQQPPSSGTSRSQNSRQGYGGGWDIILPSGWGMPFWMAFIYRGARAVGLKEARICALEKGEPFFPRDFPDTAAGQAHNESLRVDGEQQYGRYPPAKRPNYHKLGVLSPFCCPFDLLVEEWRRKLSEGIRSQAAVSSSFELSAAEANPQIKLNYFYVLRSKSILGHLRQAFSNPNPKARGKMHCGKNSSTKLLPDVSNHDDSLVCVSLRMFSRGSPNAFAAIAIPTPEDLRTLNKKSNFSGPVEPLHKGSREQLSKNLIGCCTREIIGYVTAGDYSLARGVGAGLGFCILRGIVKAFAVVEENNEFVVLVRNTNTQQYRFAYLNVV